MTQQLWRPAVIGIAAGAFFYFAPFFFFRGFFVFILIALALRFFWFRRHGWRYRNHYDPIVADAIRSMSAEEYEKFRSRNFHYRDADTFRNRKNTDKRED